MIVNGLLLAYMKMELNDEQYLKKMIGTCQSGVGAD